MRARADAAIRVLYKHPQLVVYHLLAGQSTHQGMASLGCNLQYLYNPFKKALQRASLQPPTAPCPLTITATAAERRAWSAAQRSRHSRHAQ